jgi:formylmethanofuran dehydrogenase subunit D
MLKHIKTAKIKNIRTSLLKLIPAVTRIALIIGAINMMPVFLNNTVVLPAGEPNATVAENISDTNSLGSVIDENVVTVVTEIGSLSITTPKGQEPIENENGTITLPGGGWYINRNGDKVTVSEGTIIESHGGINMNYTINQQNLDSTIIFESPDGKITVWTKDGYIIDGEEFSMSEEWKEYAENEGIFSQDDLANRHERLLEEQEARRSRELAREYPENERIFLQEDLANWHERFWEEEKERWSKELEKYTVMSEENPEEYWNEYAWITTTNGDMRTFTLKNGTAIELTKEFDYTMSFKRTSDIKPYFHAFMEPKKDVTITLANGIIIEAPGGATIYATPVKDADHELEIIVGDDGAVIINTDGTEIIVPKGTIIDGEGNVIR